MKICANLEDLRVPRLQQIVIQMKLKTEEINVKTKKALVDILDPKLRSIIENYYLVVGNKDLLLNHGEDEGQKNLKKKRAV